MNEWENQWKLLTLFSRKKCSDSKKNFFCKKKPLPHLRFFLHTIFKKISTVYRTNLIYNGGASVKQLLSIYMRQKSKRQQQQQQQHTHTNEINKVNLIYLFAIN
jgi:hypothetical protein